MNTPVKQSDSVTIGCREAMRRVLPNDPEFIEDLIKQIISRKAYQDRLSKNTCDECDEKAFIFRVDAAHIGHYFCRKHYSKHTAIEFYRSE